MMTWTLTQKTRNSWKLLTQHAENPKIQMTKSGVNASAISSADALIWMMNEHNTTPVQLVTDVIRLTTLYNWPMG